MRVRGTFGYGATTAVLTVAMLAAIMQAHDATRSGGTWVTAGESTEESPTPTLSTPTVELAPATPDATTPATLLHQNPVTVTASGFWSWALLDRRTGAIVGSANLGQAQSTASMIKAWLAADYLRLAAERGQRPGTAALRQLSIMIRDSDNAAASATYATASPRVPRLNRIRPA